MWQALLLVFLTALLGINNGAHFLTVDKTTKKFKHNGQTIFLAGMNQAWNDYARDFGNHLYAKNKADLERYLKAIHDAGGNSVRIWLHIEGENTPQFDSHGFVTAPDRDGTLISDMKQYLQAAYRYNILVFFCLWNGATHQTDKLEGLIKTEAKLDTYINKALIPIVRGVKSEPALGGWDIINEPNNVMIPYLYNSERCFDTKSFAGGGKAHLYTMQQIQKFVNWQADAIHREDPKSLVTVGVINQWFITDQFYAKNFYTDHCLKLAGARNQGHLDFYTVHTYASSSSHYQGHAPFLKNADDYKLDKPIVIAEFSEYCGGGMTINQQYQYAYNHGWSGAWSWHARGPKGSCSDDLITQEDGIRSVRNYNDQSKGGLVKLNLHV
ncbi:mannan endo-1,4-beta-mannosidase-like [Liolophura sinensis]|uniref:mannan endo-1,4-beta-mannosidase-like n=1 Tax=Liolophura sinensis TaxID=3198878 RepID=UPI003158344C